MAEEETERRELKRYRVQLDGNRGETVMKLTAEDAEKMGDRVLGEADSEQKQHGMPEAQTKFADQSASEDPSQAASDPGAPKQGEETEEETEQAKARTTSTKQKSPRNKQA